MEVFVKELDRSKLTFNIKQFNDKNPIGYVVEDTLNLIERCKDDKGITLNIDGITNATLDLDARYIPMKYKLDISESVDSTLFYNLLFFVIIY